MNYVVAGIHPWNKGIFDLTIRRFQGSWTYVTNKAELEQVYEICPRYIFFLHWSDIVPDDIIENFECVCFHPSHLPYGRGGTPIQNLIMRGFTETQLTAFRMTSEIDAGPIYASRSLTLDGSLQEIFAREMVLAAMMIKDIIKNEPCPLPQEGEPVIFHRRKPADGNILDIDDSCILYDIIRMLDANGYPRAFIEGEHLKFEFSNAERTHDGVRASVRIRRKE